MVLHAIGVALLFVFASVWFFHRFSKRGAEEKESFLFRIGFTAVALVMMIAGAKSARQGGLGAAVALVEIILPLSILVPVWLPSLVELLTGGLTGAMTGGNDRVEPKAFYFRAEALRKKGDYAGALESIEDELKRFPDDFDGLMLRAEVYAVDFKNLSAARLQLDEIERDESKTANQRVLAALKHAELIQKLDLPATRQIWERIVSLYPGSPAAQLANQNLAHFIEAGAVSDDPGALVMPAFEQNVGLLNTPTSDLAKGNDSPIEAGLLVAQLEAYPDDIEAREKLANIYADFYGRTNLAVEQLEMLVAMPSQPARKVAEWLTRISDWHARDPETLPLAKVALQEIVDRYPDTAQAVAARSRLSTIGRVVRTRQRTATLKLGEYEQNIGLKPGSRSDGRLSNDL